MRAACDCGLPCGTRAWQTIRVATRICRPRGFVPRAPRLGIGAGRLGTRSRRSTRAGQLGIAGRGTGLCPALAAAPVCACWFGPSLAGFHRCSRGRAGEKQQRTAASAGDLVSVSSSGAWHFQGDADSVLQLRSESSRLLAPGPFERSGFGHNAAAPAILHRRPTFGAARLVRPFARPVRACRRVPRREVSR